MAENVIGLKSVRELLGMNFFIPETAVETLSFKLSVRYETKSVSISIVWDALLNSEGLLPPIF